MYEYAPTKAEIREKIGTKKTIKRKISRQYRENNVKNLEQLETIIRSLDESIDDGTIGYIEHQYFRKLELGADQYTYEDNWETFFFFVSSKYNIIIIGGGTEQRRNAARNILVEFLSGDISFLTTIFIKTAPMLELVNKIKKQGPVDGDEYKNIMTDAVWKFIRKDSHGGAKREEINMHRDDTDPHCVSKYRTFEDNVRDSDAFDATMAIYRCNGILSQLSQRASYLEIFEDATFQSSTDPSPHHWIVFVIETCKKALGIRGSAV